LAVANLNVSHSVTEVPAIFSCGYASSSTIWQKPEPLMTAPTLG